MFDGFNILHYTIYITHNTVIYEQWIGMDDTYFSKDLIFLASQTR